MTLATLTARRRLRASSVGVMACLAATIAASPASSHTDLVPADADGARSVASTDVVAPCVLPVAHGQVVAVADMPHERWQPGHRGIDVAVRVGQEVVAPARGTVEYVGFVVDRPVVTLRHTDGVRTSLEPVETTLSVGDVVERGTPVGTASAAPGHCAPQTCVHWGMRHGDDYVDPLMCVPGFGPIVLLSYDGT